MIGVPIRQAVALALWAVIALGACATEQAGTPAARAAGPTPSQADDLMIVDCLLPGRIHKLGTQITYLTPRRPIRTSGHECAKLGGEYVSWDRADYGTALKVWLPQAMEGDPTAQTYVGEIYEKGLGVPADYGQAAQWYRRAAEAGSKRAAVNLGQLYERGLGVPRDAAQAAAWYRRAAGSSDAVFRIDTGGAETPPAPTPPAPKPKPAPAVAPPAIVLTEPELIRSPGGLPEVRLQAPVDRLEISGRVTSTGRLARLTINKREQPVAPDGTFRAEIKVEGAAEQVRIEAVDEGGRTARLDFLLKRRPAAPSAEKSAPPRLAMGNYHALVIGNSDYRLLPRLDKATEASAAVAKVLREEYGFNVTQLTDASRMDILRALNSLRGRLTDADNLLIYYSGHGKSDGEGRDGYWLPVDAEPGDPASWISNRGITDTLDAMKVRQGLVATDSCYVGTLSRGSIGTVDWGNEPARREGLVSVSKRRSRMVMTAGTCEPREVAGQLTAFTRAFLEILSANADALPGNELFRLLEQRMALAGRPGAASAPQYAPIRYAGHEAGDFVFLPMRAR